MPIIYCQFSYFSSIQQANCLHRWVGVLQENCLVWLVVFLGDLYCLVVSLVVVIFLGEWYCPVFCQGFG